MNSPSPLSRTLSHSTFLFYLSTPVSNDTVCFLLPQVADGGQCVVLTGEQELQVHKLLLLPEAIEGALDPAEAYMSLWREYW